VRDLRRRPRLGAVLHPSVADLELVSGTEDGPGSWMSFVMRLAQACMGLGLLAMATAYSLAPMHHLSASRARLSALQAPRRTRQSRTFASRMMLWGFLPPQTAPAEGEPTIVEVNNQAEFESMLFSSDMVDKLLVVDWLVPLPATCTRGEGRAGSSVRSGETNALCTKPVICTSYFFMAACFERQVRKLVQSMCISRAKVQEARAGICGQGRFCQD